MSGFNSSAQSDSLWYPVYEQFTVKDGLPSMELYYSFQDKDGYMWFASDRGVVRYNGDKFETFTTDDGLVSNTIFKIDQDDKGRIWFMSNVPRLCYFKDGKISQYKYNTVFEAFFSDRKKINSYTAWNFDNDRVLLSTLWSGCVRIDKNGNLTRPDEKYSSPLGSPNTKVFFEDGLILNGLKRNMREPHATSVVCFGKTNIELPQSLVDLMKTGWLNKDQYFICGGRGLFISSPTGNSLYTFPKRIFACVFIDNKLWLGIESGGIEVYTIDGSKLTKSDHFFKNKHVTGVLKSQEGHYWITTMYNGLFVIKDMDIMEMSGTDTFLESVLYISKRADDLFLVNEKKVLSIVNANSGLNRSQIHPLGSPFMYITSDVQSDEVFVYEKAKWTRIKKGGIDFQSSVISKKNSLLNNYESDVLFDGSRGVIRHGNSGYIFWNHLSLYVSKSSSLINLPTGKFMAQLEGMNTLWCGDASGLKFVDLNTGAIHTPKSKLLQQRINTVHNSSGTFYFGTHGNGVVIKDKGSVRQLSIKNGAVRKYVTKITSKSNGVVWMMGNEGVSKLIKTPKIGYQTNEYGLIDLNCEKINDVYPDHDYLYLATNKGVRRITGGEKITKKRLPKIYLGSIEVGDSIINGTIISLDYSQNTIVVSFDAVSFEREPVVFRYRLNKDNDWTLIEERFIRLNTLENGSYFFEIQASHNRKDWTDSKFLTIEILPPFWKTWWFIGLIIILVIGIVISLVALRLRIVNKKHAENQSLMELKQKMLELQQEALTQQMNPHFIFNALGSVQNSILKGDSVQANKYLVKFSKLLRAGLNASRSQLIPLEDDMDLMRSYLAVEKTRLGDSFTFDVEGKLSSKEYSLFISPFLLQPIIENSIKHGIGEDHPSGNVSVSYIEEEDCIRIVIKDNGKGRKAAAAMRLPGHVSHGSEIAFERIKLFNNSKGKAGEFSIEDLYDDQDNPKGTKVEFTVPIIRN